MYPAQGLIDGLYTENDLPDAVTVTAGYFNAGQYLVGNFVYNKSGATYLPSQFPPPGSFPTFFGDLIATSFIDEESGPDPHYVWYLSNSFPQYGTACLIGPGYGAPVLQVNDQFADSYTFSAAGMSPSSVVVTRRSLCRWDFFEEDPEGGGRYWILEYATDRRPDALWYFTIPSTFPVYKIGLQNSPVGTYTFGFGTWTTTIS